MFLATMKPRALAKWEQHPGLFDRDRVAAARTLYEFDDAFTTMADAIGVVSTSSPSDKPNA